jgi:hypothetical protein
MKYWALVPMIVGIGAIVGGILGKNFYAGEVLAPRWYGRILFCGIGIVFIWLAVRSYLDAN